MAKGLSFTWVGVTCLLLTTALGAVADQKDDKNVKEQDPRPKVVLKAQPAVSMSPSRVVLTAELLGGSNDFEEYYCPTIEWDWGDGTRSEARNDCEPYQAGKSEIKRRFTVEHVFRTQGNYRVYFRLKRNDKAVGAATANIQVRPGLRDIGEEGPR